MKVFAQGILLTLLGFLHAQAEESPQRISVAPANNLSAIYFTPPPGTGFGSTGCGVNVSQEFQEGYRIGSSNHHFEKRNILVIDDGKSSFPATDPATGLPVIALTEGKITRELEDLVEGYNAAMRNAHGRGKKIPGQPSAGKYTKPVEEGEKLIFDGTFRSWGTRGDGTTAILFGGKVRWESRWQSESLLAESPNVTLIPDASTEYHLYYAGSNNALKMKSVEITPILQAIKMGQVSQAYAVDPVIRLEGNGKLAISARIFVFHTSIPGKPATSPQ